MKDVWCSVTVTSYKLVTEIDRYISEEVTVYVMPPRSTAHFSLTDAESNEVERASSFCHFWVFSDANNLLDGLSRSGDDFLVRSADM